MPLIKLPFDGFNHSVHEAMIEDEMASIEGVDHPDDMPTGTYDKYDFRKVHLAYAQVYTDQLQQFIKAEEGIDITLTFVSVHHPREYNFSTDTIDAEITTEDLETLTNHVVTNYRKKLEHLVKEAGTPTSGYAPFVSPDILKWGPVSTWNPAQLELLLQSLDCMDNEAAGYPIPLSIMESANANGDITDCLYAGEID